MLRRGETSALDLAERALEIVNSLGRELNAVVTVTFDRALREAQRADEELAVGHDRGLLHGIPYGAKDLLATANITTSWGASPYREQLFDFDATVIRKLESAGAVLTAKLAMIELAGGMGYDAADASFTGPCKNPWGPAHWAGGSSSGSGAAVSARLLPFAIGSETSGSILSPAGLCGVAGLRPTYGRVSRHGAMALSWSLDKLGPLARTADDGGIVLGAIAGHDPADATTSSRPYNYEPQIPAAGFRFGVLKDWGNGLTAAVGANFERSLETLRELGTVTEVDLPDFPYGAIVQHIIAGDGVSAFWDLLQSGKLADLRNAQDRVAPYAHAASTSADYQRANRLRAKAASALDALCAGFDAIVSPTLATEAPVVDEPFDRQGIRPGMALIPAGNLAGLPAVTVPNGFGASGLPTGLCLAGRAWSENALLSAARAYQERTSWHRPLPPFAT